MKIILGQECVKFHRQNDESAKETYSDTNIK